MEIQSLEIYNYRSCREVKFEVGSLHALVGANNAGKSVILRALDFLINPSVTKIDEETFWNGDTSLEIKVVAKFCKLSSQDKENLKGYLLGDNSFIMARTANLVQENGEDKVKISQKYFSREPEPLWLRESEVNTKKITEWWANKESLKVGDISFVDFVGNSKPGVGDWKRKVREFINKNEGSITFDEVWNDNPSGYSGVLHGVLPTYIYIPAVREVSDEAKFNKTNPFGLLMTAMMSEIADEQAKQIKKSLKSIENKLNKNGGKSRLKSLEKTENRLNELMNEHMDCEFEIEFRTPSMEDLLSSPKFFIDDGFRNAVENKGHGLQRSAIFSILRCYSELLKNKPDGKSRTVIFGIEEPEIYMHPQAQRTIRRILVDIASKGDQVFYSTHSSLLVDVAHFDEILRVEAKKCTANKKQSVESKVWQLTMEDMKKDLKKRHPKATPTADSIRELYSHAYHPTRSEGFFAKKIILVEGATEQYCLPIYAEALGYSLEKENISVVDCAGKGPMDRLYRIFNELGISCYVLFDYDDGNSDNEIVAKSEELLKMFDKSPDPPINKVMVSNRVACFKHTWEKDLVDEIPKMGKLTTEAKKFLGLRKNSGKPLIARYIAIKLCSETPPQVPESLKVILESAIKVEWAKSCLAHKQDN